MTTQDQTQARTVMQALEEAARRFADLPALRAREEGQWQTTTWAEYHAQVRMTARALVALGLEPGDGVVIIGRNCPEWLLSNLGTIFAGGIPAGIYTTSSPEQCRYVIQHCSATIAVVGGPDLLARFQEAARGVSGLKGVIMMAGQSDDATVHAWSELPALAEQVPETVLDARIQAQKVSDVCTLIYTSGTTGNPKGVMITHDNVTWTGNKVTEVVEVGPDDRVVSYLPLSHVAEQTVSLYCPLASGMCCSFAPSLDLLGEYLREVRPTLFVAVPRVWEKMQAKIQTAGAANPAWKKKLGAWARVQGHKSSVARQQKKPDPLLYGLADRLVFSKVRKALGLDCCRMAATTAAPISLETLEFFASLGIPIYEVFGLSECTGPTTISLPNRYRLGKAGVTLPGTEVKIAEDGEILLRGRHVFAGYYRDEHSTIEVLDKDGWFHTGDVGVFDSDGFLSITDRMKDILITSGGENIAPQMIERKLGAIPAVSQSVVVGNRRKYLTVLLTLDPERIAAVAAEAGSPATDLESAAVCTRFRSYIEGQINDVNRTLARVQTIKKFTILPREFSVDGGDLTPTMKVRRRVVNAKYAKEIEEMYAYGS